MSPRSSGPHFTAHSLNVFDEFSKHVEPYTLEMVAERTGLTAAAIEEVAELIHTSERSSFWWTMGVNQSYEGVRTAQSLINLALINTRKSSSSSTTRMRRAARRAEPALFDATGASDTALSQGSGRNPRTMTERDELPSAPRTEHAQRLSAKCRKRSIGMKNAVRDWASSCYERRMLVSPTSHGILSLILSYASQRAARCCASFLTRFSTLSTIVTSSSLPFSMHVGIQLIGCGASSHEFK